MTILAHDQSQIEYYGKIIRDMVGRVLRNHKIVEREGKTYRLNDFQSLTKDEITSLFVLCEKKFTCESVGVKLSRATRRRYPTNGFVWLIFKVPCPTKFVLSCVPKTIRLQKRMLFGVNLGERGPQNHFWAAVAKPAA